MLAIQSSWKVLHCLINIGATCMEEQPHLECGLAAERTCWLSHAAIPAEARRMLVSTMQARRSGALGM